MMIRCSNKYSPKLVIVPSPHNFSDESLQILFGHIKSHGGTLLFTGPIGLDAYWRPTGRFRDELKADVVANVLREEMLELNGRILPISFGGSRIADTNKQLLCNNGNNGQVTPSKLVEATLGNGRIIWCPLPIELNNRAESIKQVYQYVLEKAGVDEELQWISGGSLPGLYGRKLKFAAGNLFIFVSEYAHPAIIKVKDPDTGRQYSFTLESERSVLFATRDNGEIFAVYRENEVKIE